MSFMSIFAFLSVIYVLATLGLWAYRQFIYKCSLQAYRGNSNSGNSSGAWVVVTGATDGCGLAFAKEFAKRQFNVFLISRTEAKLQTTQQDIKKLYPQVEVRYLAADANEAKNEHFDQVAQALKDLNVTILVNNVGIATECPEEIGDMTNEEIDRLIRVNCTYPTKLTRALVPLLKRNKRSAIINVSSISCILDTPLLAVYAATKAYNRTFSLSIGPELQSSGVDVLCVTPAYISSAMTRLKPSAFVASAEQFASGSIDKIGLPEISPFPAHALIQVFFEIIVPRPFKYFFSGITLQNVRQIREKIKRRAAKKE